MSAEFQFEEEIQDDAQGTRIIEEFSHEVAKLKMENDTEKQKLHIESKDVQTKFIVLVRFFTRMGQIRGRKKGELLSTFADHFLKEDRDPARTYQIIRMIIPYQDRDRGKYNLQEKAIAKLFHNALGLPESEYQRMANFKHASLQPYGAPVGDFPLVVQSIIDGFCRKDSIVTIGEVDKLLDELVFCVDTKAQVAIVTRLLQRCTSDEIVWVIRIILKDLKIGIKYEKVLELFHPDAPEYFNATSSLQEVCKEFQDRNHSLKNVLRLFHPIKPMLAAKKSPEEIRQLLQGKQFVVETKYDGERIQCHFTPDQLRFFTRNSNDYTHIYKEKMGDIIRQCVSAHSAILDGEIVVVDKHTGESVRFGLNKTVAREVDDDTYRLCYRVFDILYVKGLKGEECNMMNLKLSDRRKILEKIIKPIEHHMELSKSVYTETFEELVIEFDKAMMRNEEGIIIKQLDSDYHPNERSSKWMKMKGDYVENMTDNCDLLVIGGFYGTNSHRVEKNDAFDRITHFMMGLAGKIDKNNPNNSLIIPFTKVGTGFTDNELSQIRGKLRPFWMVRDSNKSKPNHLPQNWNPGINDRPDVYIDCPANSMVFEVKAAEISKSNQFPTDYTLRFPRCFKIRYDKQWHEIMTLQDLNQMINDTQYTKNMKKKGGESGVNSLQGSDDELGDRPIKQAKQRKQPAKRGQEARVVNVMRQFQGVDQTQVARESKLLQDCEFYLVNVVEQYDKQYLETLIIQNGGSCVQNFLVDTVTHLVASQMDFRVETILDRYPITVIKPQWVIECLRRQQLVNLAPRFILYATDQVMSECNKYYDRFGDSYIENIDQQALQDILNNMDITNMSLDNRLMNKLEDRVVDSCSKLWIFRGKAFYLYAYAHQMNDDEILYLKTRIRGRGGELVDSLEECNDYVVLFPNMSFIQEKQLEILLGRKPYIKTTNIENIVKLL